jgi:hypothetical protein
VPIVSTVCSDGTCSRDLLQCTTPCIRTSTYRSRCGGRTRRLMAGEGGLRWRRWRPPPSWFCAGSSRAAKFKDTHQRGPQWADPMTVWDDVLVKQGKTKEALAKNDEALKYAPKWGSKSGKRASQQRTRRVDRGSRQQTLARGRNGSGQSKPALRSIRQQAPQDRALAVPNCSPLSCRPRIGERLPFTHSLVCKILISAGFMA